MATPAQSALVECPECGGEMELQKSWTRKSVPLVGSEIEVGEFLCQDCGVGRRFERDGPTDTWS